MTLAEGRRVGELPDEAVLVRVLRGHELLCYHYKYVYIYIYIERERERKVNNKKKQNIHIIMLISMYGLLLVLLIVV